MTNTMKIQARGQVTLPKRARELLGLKPGDSVVWHSDSPGAIRLERYEPMTIYEMFDRWGDHESASFEEVERLIRQAREEYARERASKYGE